MLDAYDTTTEWEADMLNHAIEVEWFHIRAMEAYAEKNRRSEAREVEATALKRAKLESRNEHRQTEDQKTARLAVLGALSKLRLARWPDLEGVLD